MTKTIEYRDGMTFDYHPVVELFRPMTEEEFNDLVNDVALNGVHEDIWMHEGQVIDGRHRSRAWLKANEQETEKTEALSLLCPECDQPVQTTRSLAGQGVPCPHCPSSGVCGRSECKKQYKDGQSCPHRLALVPIPETLRRRDVPPLPVKEWSGEGSLVEFVFSLNLHRRHLSIAERAMLAVRAAGLIEEEARQRQIAALKQGAAPLAPRGANGGNKGKTAQKLGKMAGVSSRTMERAKAIHSKGSKQLQDATRSGKVTLSAAARIANLSPQQQLKAIDAEAAKARRTNQKLDLRDNLATWKKMTEKMLRKMTESTTPVPDLVDAAKALLAAIERRTKAKWK